MAFDFWARVVVGTLSLAAMGAPQAAKRAYTLEDHLAIEQVASARSGRSVIAWTMSPPYSKIGYYGHGDGSAWEHSGASIRMTRVSPEGAETSLLFEPKPGASYILQSMSPGERFIVYCRADANTFNLGIYDRSAMAERIHDLLPVEGGCEDGDGALLWLSDEEFLMLASSATRPPLAGARPYSGTRLAEERARAWAGGLSADIQDSGADGSTTKRLDAERLVRINARTGVVTVLAHGEFEGLSISPSGKYAAVTRAERGAERTGGSSCAAGGSAARELLVFDIASGGEALRVAPNVGVAADSLSWSTTADRLAFFGCSNADASMTIYGWNAVGRVLTRYVHSGLDLASRRERGLYQRPERFVWVGDRVAVYARRHDGEDARFTPRDVELFGGEGRLPRADWYLIDAMGGSRNLTRGMSGVSPHVLSADESSIVVVADSGLWRVQADGQTKPLTEPSPDARIELPLSDRFAPSLAPLRGSAVLVDSGAEPAFLLADVLTDRVRRIRSPAPAAEYIASALDAGVVLFRQDDDEGTKLVLAREDGSSEVLMVLNAHMAEVERTIWRKISYGVTTSGKTQRTESCILLPPGFDPGKRYPVVVDVYPTRRAHCEDPSWERFIGIARSPNAVSPHLLAGHGYIVFRPNAAAELIRTDDGPLGALTSVVEQGVDELVRRGFADPGRIGLMGFSQGGFASLWVATQSSMFSTVVSLNGWSDHYVHFYDTTYFQQFYADSLGFNGAAGRYLSSTGSAYAMGISPHEDAMAYISSSPLHLVDRISAPVLLVHSDMDMFPLHEYERMYAALRSHGKRARLIRYWGEGHAPSSPENIRHMWRQIFDWLDASAGK